MTEKFIGKPYISRLILLILPLLLYLNTISHDFALDDSIVYTQNSYVQEGLSGIGKIFSTETFTGFFQQKKDLVSGSRYRPLSVASFAIEHALWGNRPGLAHLINSLLYAFLCLLLFRTLHRLLQYLRVEKTAELVAFFSTIIFIIHPVHTEVVANIKGRDELLSVLFLLGSVYGCLRYWENRKFIWMFGSAISIFLGMLSKENAIFIWPVLAILILLNFRKDLIKGYLVTFLILMVSTLSYVYIRYSVIGGLSTEGSAELMNNPYLFASAGEKSATILYTLLVYFKLLFFPHPLTYDYYPSHIELQEWSSFIVIISLFVYLALGAGAFLMVRRNRVFSYAIFFYLLTLLPMSNLLINIGTFMNERFLFIPSIGFALFAGTLIASEFSKNSENEGRRKIYITVLTLIFLAFSVKTISRNTHWKDNYTLFTHDVRISAGSAKGNCTAGGILYESALKTNDKSRRDEMLKESIGYLQTSIKIYPNYIDALLLLGNAHYELNRNYHEVNRTYNRIFKLAPDYQLAISNFANMLTGSTDPLIRKEGFQKVLAMDPDLFVANYQMGITYGRMLDQLDSAIVYLDKALSLQPDHSGVNRDLGVAYAMQGMYEASLPCFEKVVALNPDNPDNYINLGMTYQNLGQPVKAQQLFEKAEALRRN